MEEQRECGAALEGELSTPLIQVFPSQAANCQNRFSGSFRALGSHAAYQSPQSWRLLWEVEAGNCSPTHTSVA